MSRRNLAQFVSYLLTSAGLWAQSVSIPPSVVAHGASGSLLLTLESPSGKAPIALQWEFTFPPGVAVDPADIATGSAAESSQKELTCRTVDQANSASKSTVYACILAGGQKPIPNGPVAVVRYRVPLEVRQIGEKVRAGKVIGATADLKRVVLEDAQAAIIVK